MLKAPEDEDSIDMAEPNLIAFKGRTSQTGLAAQIEFLGIDFQGADESFDEIADMLKQGAMLALLPMWNSHEGEITKARVFELLFENRARLYWLWPKTIQWECICRFANVTDISKIRSVISVSVAKTQCSAFISKTGANFLGVEATTVAYQKFSTDHTIDAALCAPGQNQAGFPVLCQDAANPMNFTSFALLGCLDSKQWSAEQWGSLHNRLSPREALYLGVQMPISSVSSEDQETLLSDLTADATTIDDIPKVLFVAKRPPDQCGLLIESGEGVLSADTLTEEGYSTEITVNPDLGETSSRYTGRIYDFLNVSFHDRICYDFVRHIGAQTCLFACPPLRIVTHGFEDSVVEPVVRRMITKYFELIDGGIRCSDSQQQFFEKHKAAYYEQGMDFINFADVGL